MRNRFVTPDAERVDIGDGDWILLKKHLTYGEYNASQAALIKEVRADGRITPDFAMIGKAEVLAYLVDWSFMQNGKAVSIDTDAKKTSAVDALTPEDFQVIRDAVTAHIAAMRELLESSKNGSGMSSGSAATSTSVAG